MRALQCRSFDAYLKCLNSVVTMYDEMRELAAKLTIGETYFFRSPNQLHVFSEIALPRLTRTNPARQIRILSAGCSTGEEPYTLAMTLRELGKSAPAEVSILGPRHQSRGYREGTARALFGLGDARDAAGMH